MADNTTLNAGTGGDTLAADDIAGVKYQRVKPAFGGDGVATDVSSSDPLPVIAASNSGVDIGDVTINNGTGASSVPVQGGAAHDAAVAGNPLLLAGSSSAAAPADVAADGRAVRLWSLRNGSLVINLAAAGALIGGDAANGLDVDVTRSALPTGASTSARQDTGNTSLANIEASASVLDDWDETDRAKVNLIVGQAGVQGASGTVSATTQRVVLATDVALPAGTNNIGDVDVLTLPGVAGTIAHDTGDSGNPVKIGGFAETAISGRTLVSDGDRTDFVAGIDGVPIVRNHCNLEDVVSAVATNTDGTSTQVIAAQAAGVKTYLTCVEVANTSASTVTVDIKDNATVKWTLLAPAGGANKVYFDPPLPGTAATAWNFDPSAAATTITCSAIGFKSKV